MLAKLKKYFQESQRRYRMIKEARAILQALDLPSGEAPDLGVMTILMQIGLGHLRAAKKSQDYTLASREMERQIQDGPRPTYEEAGLN